jgi:hypothetical protein
MEIPGQISAEIDIQEGLKMRIGSAAFPNVNLFADPTRQFGFGGLPAKCEFGFAHASFTIGGNPDGTCWIGVTGNSEGYLLLDGTGVHENSPSGGGRAYFSRGVVDPGQKFRFVPQSDGTTAIASVAFPGVYLRMDGTGLSAGNPGPGGVINAQYGVDGFAKFLLINDAVKDGVIKSNWSAPLSINQPGMGSCLAGGQVWQATDDGLQGFDQLTGARTHWITFGPAPTKPRAAVPRDDGLLVFCADHGLYQVSLDPGRAAQPTRVIGSDPPGGWGEPWLLRFGASVYVVESKNGIQRVPSQEELDRNAFTAWGVPYGRGFNLGIPSFIANSPNGTMLTATTNNTINAVDARAMVDLWSVPLPGWLSSGATTCNGDYLCVVVEGKTLCAISLRDRRQAWKRRETLIRPRFARPPSPRGKRGAAPERCVNAVGQIRGLESVDWPRTPSPKPNQRPTR